MGATTRRQPGLTTWSPTLLVAQTRAQEVNVAVLRLLFFAELRHRWRSWALLCVLIALVSGLVLAAGAAGRRTSSAFPQFVSAYGYDAFDYSLEPLPQIAHLPEVTSTVRVRLPTGGKPTCSCTEQINTNDFSVMELAPSDLRRSVKLVAGRMPDQSSRREVLASFTLERLGVHVGSVIRVPFFARSQRQAALAGGTVTPTGPTVALHVVGIEAAELEFPGISGNPSYDLYDTQALARSLDPDGVVLSEYFVRLRHGAADLPAFEAAARQLGALSGTDLDTPAAAVTSSIHPQAVGWWILAGLAVLAGVAVVTQALSRQALVEAESFDTLRALGVSQRRRAQLGVARTLVVAVVGALGGMALAFGLSPLTPVGEARLAEPSTGLSFDGLVLGLGALATVVVVVGLGLWPSIRAARHRRIGDQAPLHQPSRIAALLSLAGAPPSTLIGVRHALERERGRRAVPVGSALLGSVLAVAALCATAVFGASLSHLTATPSLYGQPFDVWFANNGAGSPTAPSPMLSGLLRYPSVTAVTAGISGDVLINGRTVDALAGQAERGGLLVSTVNGRLPGTAHEVTLGAKTMREIGARVGSAVHVTVPRPGGGRRTSSFTVAGTASFPPDFGTGGLGTGAVFTIDGYLGAQCPPGPSQRHCVAQATSNVGGAFLVRAAPGPAGRSAIARLARANPGTINYPYPPTGLVNFGEAVNFPLLVGLVLLVYGMATLIHVLVVSVARRRHEIGLLKTLGFVRRQEAALVSWQATTIGLVGIVLGVPLGVAVGQAVWRAFADNLGVVPTSVVLAWVMAAVAVGTLVVANVLALGPAFVASRARPAGLLRTE
jgi:ABC-type lipoprotein release transport system permease subunit